MKTFKLVFLIIVLSGTTWLMILGAKVNAAHPIDTASIETISNPPVSTNAVLKSE